MSRWQMQMPRGRWPQHTVDRSAIWHFRKVPRFRCECVLVAAVVNGVSMATFCFAQAAICLTIGMIGNPDVDYLSWAVNWGVAYDLPNHNWVIQHAHGFAANLTKPMLQRRSRRSFFDEVQSAFDHMGFNGRACVARALCESAKYMHAPGQRGNMLEELVRAVFSLPTSSVAAHEPRAHHHYDRIYRHSKRQLRDCHELYPGCHFSLLALALGNYAAAPAQFSKYNFM
ncbi:hypothetical protein KR093_010252 [Drosophila rubida]|uniref:Uncharacterized protein n=1 Tax=Drosophila rubida TaxID=30044 RepID=A0AAD4JUY3_9MUSC|nr:hypothetical protein KR093_010252 [Drosophila rubida]